MAGPYGEGVSLDLDGKAAIDTTLEDLQIAIARNTSQKEVKLGLQEDEDHSNDVIGIRQPDHFIASSKILVYGTRHRHSYYPSHNILVKNDVRNRDEHEESNTSVDPRLFSKVLFLNSEVKAAGDFSRSTVNRLFNIPIDHILTSGITLSNVSASQARRTVNEIRQQYAAGEWRNALQLAEATKHINVLGRSAASAVGKGKVTISDPHIEKVLREEYATDTLFLTMRALKIGIKSLRAEGRDVAAHHGKQWLSLLKENVYLDKFTPEVKTKDILRYPSCLNPRPDKGIPEIADTAFAASGPNPRNLTIKYPNGDIYRVDFPFDNARPIKGYQDDGYAGNLTTGLVASANINSGWSSFEETVRRVLKERHQQ